MVEKNLNSLEKDAQDLLAWLSKMYEIPAYKKKLVVVNDFDMTEIDGHTYNAIKAKDVCEFIEFEPRYQKLKKAGYSWINLHCGGILDDSLVFTIELPRESVNVPYGYTSINFSGPFQNHKTKKIEWDFTKNYRLM